MVAETTEQSVQKGRREGAHARGASGAPTHLRAHEAEDEHPVPLAEGESTAANVRSHKRRIHEPDFLSELWRKYDLHRGGWPLAGSVVTGVGVTALAMACGVTEVLVGLGAGYAAYLMLRRGLPLSAAVREGFDLEKEIFAGK